MAAESAGASGPGSAARGLRPGVSGPGSAVTAARVGIHAGLVDLLLANLLVDLVLLGDGLGAQPDPLDRAVPVCRRLMGPRRAA